MLECGHPVPVFPVGHVGGTGYGTDRITGARHCYACCAEIKRAQMIATGRATLYLQAPTRGVTVPNPRKDYAVTDWAGCLSFVAFNYRHSRNGGGFGSQRSDVDFIGPDGYIWHATNRGDNEIAQCKRTVRKAGPGIEEVRS